MKISFPKRTPSTVSEKNAEGTSEKSIVPPAGKPDGDRPLPNAERAALQLREPHGDTRPPVLDITVEAGVLHVGFGGDWKLGAPDPQVAADISRKMESIRATLSATANTKTGSSTQQYGSRPTGTTRISVQSPLTKKRRFFHRKRVHPVPLLTSSPVLALELSGEDLGDWDSSLLVLTTQFIALARERSIPVRDARLPEGVRNLTALALAVPPNTGARRSEQKTSMLELIGEKFLSLPAAAGNILHFLGEIVCSFGRLFRGRSSCTSSSIWVCIQEGGVEALPIVSLISLLVGLILAFVGVLQLSMFGAEIYVSSLVAVGMTRIMGAIMTGIILAGRTSASYAAVIGTMQVNEEIDALTTLGVAPSDFLVMPRILAMTAMTPLLVLYSDFMGILGGFIVGVGVLGLDPMEYYTFTQRGFGLNNLWVGIAHGLVFGLVVAITGCYQGLRCGRSAEAVGTATTSAVVFSIVGIVLSTAVLTLLCNLLKI